MNKTKYKIGSLILGHTLTNNNLFKIGDLVELTTDFDIYYNSRRSRKVKKEESLFVVMKVGKYYINVYDIVEADYADGFSYERFSKIY